MTNNIFSSADILLPDFPAGDDRYHTWSVIACDQFTSETEYWARCRNVIGDAESTYNFILPEAYLGTPLAEEHKRIIADSMSSADDIMSKVLADSFVYIERTLPDGAIRPGIVGKIDLAGYDYSVGSSSPVRATEATVLERIPPRCEVRASAAVELPHVMLLTDDPDMKMYKTAAAERGKLLYDFELMEGGGHLAGWQITGASAEALTAAISDYEASRTAYAEAPVVYAVGDGNHSLAAAKAHFENLRGSLGDAALTHPARYALVEIVSLHSPAIVFEPIYRLVKGCDAAKLICHIESLAGTSSQSVTMISNGKDETVSIAAPTHALTVGSLQNIIDAYLLENNGECDYIHGTDALKKLAQAPDSVGFLFDGMKKEDLFDYVCAHGSLPRKTFSMGEAKSKRYYTEARKIII